MPVALDGNGPTDSPPTVPKNVSLSAGTPGLQGLVTLSDPNDVNQYINPDPDPRLNDIVSRTAPNLARGVIQQTRESQLAGGGADAGGNAVGVNPFPFACQFLFNPGEINVGYSVADGVTPAGALTPAQAAGAGIFPGQTTIDFNLLFDRTYEVSYPPYYGYKDISKVGCYIDIAFLEYITGVKTSFVNTVVTTPSTDGTSPPTTSTQQLAGNMVFSPVFVAFGGGVNTPGLSFVAVIQRMSVTYAHFSEEMVPMRCGVTISMQQMIGQDVGDTNVVGSGTITDIIRQRKSLTSGM